MIPTPARCLAMTVAAIALAAGLLMAGVPGAALLAFTPGLLCLAMAFVMGHPERGGKDRHPGRRAADRARASSPVTD